MSAEPDYDIIICGAGLAGLSLAVHLLRSGKFTDKKILLIDNKEKNTNDRTWCFWEKESGLFEEIVYRKWNHVWFHSENFSRLLDLSPYEYKMVRSIDFYNYCFNIIRQQENFEIHYTLVESVHSNYEGNWVLAGGKKITATYIFNSIVFQKPALKKKEYWLLQHFKGWVIESRENLFQPAHATLMDFRMEQKHGTTFIYIMPFSENTALIEYTVFSPTILQHEQYDEGLKNYINRFLKTRNYSILQEESGIIPMTNHRFTSHSENLINIGTAGGQTKPSTGYTFRFIQKHSELIASQLMKTGNPPPAPVKNRFNFYDSVFLDILYNNRVPGTKIFTALFKNNTPRHVLRFLDNESRFSEELKIISSLPAAPFLRAALKRLSK